MEPMPAPLTTETIARIVALRATGLVERDIARALDVSPSVVHRYLVREENAARVADLREQIRVNVMTKLAGSTPKVLDAVDTALGRLATAPDSVERARAASALDATTRAALALEKIGASAAGENRRGAGPSKVSVNVRLPAWLTPEPVMTGGQARAHEVTEAEFTCLDNGARALGEGERAEDGDCPDNPEQLVLTGFEPAGPPVLTTSVGTQDAGEAPVLTGGDGPGFANARGVAPQNRSWDPLLGGVTFGEHCAPRANVDAVTDADVSGTPEGAEPSRPPGPAGSAALDNPIPDDFEV